MSIDIHGKEYVMVNERIKAFRDNFPNHALLSEIVKLTDDCVVVKASILNEEQRVIATGHAQEDRSSSNINKTSYVENCETSAWGRALANLGIGIDAAIASTEEVVNAVMNQNPDAFSDKASEKQIAYLKKLIQSKGLSVEEAETQAYHKKIEDMTKKEISDEINKLKG